jgi:hypothetical protein
VIQAEVEIDEEEYEIEAVVNDDIHVDKKTGVETIIYEIKWAGDWGNTWEPINNVPYECFIPLLSGVC